MSEQNEIEMELVQKADHDYTVNFLLCTDKEPYDTWVVLQAASLVDLYEAEGTLHLLSIEIVYWHPLSPDHLRGIRVLQRKMGERLLCRHSTCSAPGAQKGRFLEVPTLKCDITYIGDVDMFATNGHGFIAWHARNMHSDRTCVSNVFRDWNTRTRLTGCTAVFTEPYYAYLSKFLQQDSADHPVHRRIANDEVMMTHVVTHMCPDQMIAKRIQNHGRKIVGLHISPNRGDGKVMNHGHYNVTQLNVIKTLLLRPCMQQVLAQDDRARGFVRNVVEDAEMHVKRAYSGK